MTKTLAAVTIVGLGLVALPQAYGDTWDKNTVLTVHQAIQVPGAILEPGKYVMKLHGSRDFRNIVQVTNERGDKVVATMLTIPHYREKQTDQSEFRFWEIAEGQAKPLRAWFYPGDTAGHEFVYPKGFATNLAKSAHVDVPAMDTEAKSEAALENVRLEMVTETGGEKSLDVASYSKTEFLKSDIAAPEVLEASWTGDAPAVHAMNHTAEPAATHHYETLPETASGIPVTALASAASLLAGLGLTRMAQRT